MGMDYKLVLVLGVELEREYKQIEYSVTKYNPDTGVPYERKLSKDVNIFSSNGKELFQLELEYWDCPDGWARNGETHEELKFLPPALNLYISEKVILGIEIKRSECVRAGNSLVMQAPNINEEIFARTVTQELEKLGIDMYPTMYTILAVSS
jgi:hypothetical protein